jgi:hypothetical protein
MEYLVELSLTDSRPPLHPSRPSSKCAMQVCQRLNDAVVQGHLNQSSVGKEHQLRIHRDLDGDEIEIHHLPALDIDHLADDQYRGKRAMHPRDNQILEQRAVNMEYQHSIGSKKLARMHGADFLHPSIQLKDLLSIDGGDIGAVKNGQERPFGFQLERPGLQPSIRLNKRAVVCFRQSRPPTVDTPEQTCGRMFSAE